MTQPTGGRTRRPDPILLGFANAAFPFGGISLGYSYFNYDQMTLLNVEVYSDELELLKDAADEYDWHKIESEVEPLFVSINNNKLG